MKFKAFLSLFLSLLFVMLASVPVFAEDLSADTTSQSESQDVNQTVDELYYLERIYILLFIIAGFTISGIFIARPRRWL